MKEKSSKNVHDIYGEQNFIYLKKSAMTLYYTIVKIDQINQIF